MLEKTLRFLRSSYVVFSFRAKTFLDDQLEITDLVVSFWAKIRAFVVSVWQKIGN